MKLSKGRTRSPLKVVIYGPEGIGKSTFASQFPEPVFIDTEGSTRHMDVLRVDPAPRTWTELLVMVREMATTYADGYGTLVIDTADWAEKMCVEELCAHKQWKGIEDAGYGKGYTYLAEEFGKLLNALEEVIRAGNNVVVTAHAAMRKFEQPEEIGAYDRWELKLQKKTAPLLKEWADAVFFANYKTVVVNVDDKGAAKGKNKVQGGSRVMYTSHHPVWDAKNRFGLPDELPFDYAHIAHIVPAPLINDASAVQQNVEPEPQSAPVSAPQAPPMEMPASEPMLQERRQEAFSEPVPEELARLMRMDNVSAEEIRLAVATVGVYPQDTPIAEYEKDFVLGCLVADWAGVMKVVADNRKTPPCTYKKRDLPAFVQISLTVSNKARSRWLQHVVDFIATGADYSLIRLLL